MNNQFLIEHMPVRLVEIVFEDEIELKDGPTLKVEAFF